MTAQLDEIAHALGDTRLDGWLFYDFRLSDPLAYRILGLSEDGIATRRWFCFVPAHGKPRAIVSAVEAHRLDALGVEKIVYRSHDEMIAALRTVLGGARRIAMDYSPGCAIPYVSRVDAGTVEIVRAMNIEVVTAADLIQRFEATLTREQLGSHQRAARALRAIVDETFREIAQLISADRAVSEVSVQESVMARFAARGLVTHAPPIVAVNEHSADPHYGPTPKHDRAIRRSRFYPARPVGEGVGARQYLRRLHLGCVRRRQGSRRARAYFQHCRGCARRNGRFGAAPGRCGRAG